MKSFTLLTAICFAVLATVTVRAEDHPQSAIVKNAKLAQDKSEKIDEIVEDVDSGNASGKGQQIIDGLYQIADLVAAANTGTCEVPEDICASDANSKEIIESMDDLCSEYQDLIDSIGQCHDDLARAGFEGAIRDALDHSYGYFQNFADGMHDAIPCREKDIDDNVEDMEGKFTNVISIYNGQH